MVGGFGGGFSRGARVGLRRAVRSGRPRAARPLPIYPTVPGYAIERAARTDYPSWGDHVRCSDSTQRIASEVRDGVSRNYVEVSMRLTNDFLGETLVVVARTPAGLGSKLDRLFARWNRAVVRQVQKQEAEAFRRQQRDAAAELRLEEAARIAHAKRDGTYRTNLNPYGGEIPDADPVVAVRLDPESSRRARVRWSLIERIARGASSDNETAVAGAYWGYLNCQSKGGNFLGLQCGESAHKHRVVMLPEDQSAKVSALIVGSSNSRPPRLIDNRRKEGLRVQARSGVKPLVQVQYCGSEEEARVAGLAHSGYVHRWPFEEEPYLGAWVIAGGTLAVVVAFGRGSYRGPTRQLDEFIGGNASRGSMQDRLQVFRQYMNRTKRKQPWGARDHFEFGPE